MSCTPVASLSPSYQKYAALRVHGINRRTYQVVQHLPYLALEALDSASRPFPFLHLCARVHESTLMNGQHTYEKVSAEDGLGFKDCL